MRFFLYATAEVVFTFNTYLYLEYGSNFIQVIAIGAVLLFFLFPSSFSLPIRFFNKKFILKPTWQE